jgi:hypothetical protein
VSNGLWNESVQTFQFVNSYVRLALVGRDGRGGPLPQPHVGGWWRSIAWQSTLTKLTDPGDFQAVFAAARALLEITVDAVLLQHLPDAAAQLRDWEDSAKLKQAEGIARFIGTGTPDAESRHAIAFAQREAARINAARVARGWTKKQNGAPLHPDRWTTRTLGDDAKRADGFEPDADLERAYELSYRKMCWYVHGSGAVGLNSIGADNFPGLGGLMFHTCTKLVVTHAKLLLKYAGLWGTAYEGRTWPELFEELLRAQVLIRHAAAFGQAGDD